jgi:hypothetical protein
LWSRSGGAIEARCEAVGKWMASSCGMLEIANLFKICMMTGAHSVITTVYSSFNFIRTQLLFITFLSSGIEFPTNFEKKLLSRILNLFARIGFLS